MRVLFLDQFSELGGAQRCLADLIPAALGRDWSVTAALPGEGPFAHLLKNRGVEVEFLPCGPYTPGWKTIGDAVRFALDSKAQGKVIARLIEKHRPDVLYVNGPRLLPAARRASGCLPLLFHSHSYLSKWYAVALVGRPLRNANTHVIASSHFVAAPLLRFLAEDRIRIIYNGTAEIPFQPRVPPAGRPWRIGVLGRIAQEKGQLELVQAARILRDSGLSAEYSVHGDSMFSSSAYFDSVRVASAGLPIRFTGWHESVGPLLSELDILVVPSPTYESTTRVVLEAYSAGTPVVAFATGGIPEVIRDGETGILVEPRTPEALAVAISNATLQPNALASMAMAARRRWEAEYTLARYQDQILDTVEEVGRPSKIQNNSAATSTTPAAISNTGP